MSYSSYPSSNGLGMPGSGFASRRANGTNIKRLSFEPTKSSDPQDSGAPTPRTSRSHLLAGLRTAPKSATSSTFPSTAPPTQLYHQGGLAASIYAEQDTYGGPKTSSYPSHSGFGNGHGQMNANRQMYSLPEQVLAPPEIHVDEHGQDQMDPNLYAQLVATNMYLAEQQQRLQQQLINVQAAAQQFQGLNLGMGNQMQQQFATPPITPQNAGRYQQQQQVKNNMQPIITPVPGAQAGVYSYFNPVTGQQSYFMDNGAQQNSYMDSQVVQQSVNYSPPQIPGTPRFQVSPPPQSETPTFSRSISPPKKTQSPPQDHAPLPPPSAGAFRRGHRKANSMALVSENSVPSDGPKSAGFPLTPSVVSFGPGQARAGEHPIRQPRGPPSLDELLAKPTTKFEGSKNFATRTRRSAVHNLVRAGMERRRAPGSSGSMSPVSENGEITFSVSSDNDSDSGRSGSGSLSGRPSLGSSRTSAHGAIGSDRPSSRQKEHSLERKSIASMDSNFTTASVSSEEGLSNGGSFAAVFKNGGKKPEASDVPRKAPMLVLTSAEKRKSTVF
jgi:hypothetical protein